MHNFIFSFDAKSLLKKRFTDVTRSFRWHSTTNRIESLKQIYNDAGVETRLVGRVET